MNVSSANASISAMALTNTQAQASLMVLKKTMDVQQASVLQLLQAVAPVAQIDPAAMVGGRVDTFA